MDADTTSRASRRRSGNGCPGLRSRRCRPTSSRISRLCLLDSIGCGLFGAAQPWGAIAGDVAVGFSGGGTSSLFARADKVSPADAALANGTAIHGFEIDDAHVSSSLHPGAVTAARESRDRGSAWRLGRGFADGARGRLRDRPPRRRSAPASRIRPAAITSPARSAPSARPLRRRGSCDLIAAANRACARDRRDAGRRALRGAHGRDDQALPCRPRLAKRRALRAYLAQQGFTGSLDALEAPFGGFMSTLRGQFDAGDDPERSRRATGRPRGSGLKPMRPAPAPTPRSTACANCGRGG